MPHPVIVVDYDPRWPAQFEALWRRIGGALGDLAAAIEHVGGTAVPGLAAKPVIDIDVLLWSSGGLPEAIERLAALGYVHEGDLGIAGREAFRQPPDQPAHHLYVCIPDSEEYRRHLAFRDYLRAHPESVSSYAELKRGLARQYRDDREKYVSGKDEFVNEILRRAIPPTIG
ncbi:MAG TPA: GrpB family protein [Candidatus Sulfotelmatobacter sp.]|nr:GrpB family protein [Candidatus Sulfotelmatobacter sp.]